MIAPPSFQSTKRSARRASQGASILVVDDTRANLRLMAGILTGQGYRVRPATSGRVALAAAQAEPPDIILLDLVMPEISGYEVCRELKQAELTADIPVIVISARNDIEDKVRAFEVGAVDYITKPVEAAEVLARVETHLTIRNLNRMHREQIAELDAFAHTVALDLRAPLARIAGFADLLSYGPDKLDSVTEADLVATIQRSSREVINIVDELLLLATVRKGDIVRTPIEMGPIVARVLERLEAMVEEYGGIVSMPDVWPVACGYAPWLEEAWLNYLSNGLKYGGPRPHLELGATSLPDGQVRFWVRDSGPGIPPDRQSILFTEFTRLGEVNMPGYGLGLSIVRRIMDKLEGDVGVESEPGNGSTFYFTLPAA